MAQGSRQIRYLLRSSFKGPCSWHNQPTHALARSPTELHSVTTKHANVSTNHNVLAQPLGTLQHTTFAASGNVCAGLADWGSPFPGPHCATQAKHRSQR